MSAAAGRYPSRRPTQTNHKNQRLRGDCRGDARSGDICWTVSEVIRSRHRHRTTDRTRFAGIRIHLTTAGSDDRGSKNDFPDRDDVFRAPVAQAKKKTKASGSDRPEGCVVGEIISLGRILVRYGPTRGPT